MAVKGVPAVGMSVGGSIPGPGLPQPHIVSTRPRVHPRHFLPQVSIGNGPFLPLTTHIHLGTAIQNNHWHHVTAKFNSARCALPMGGPPRQGVPLGDRVMAGGQALFRTARQQSGRRIPFACEWGLHWDETQKHLLPLHWWGGQT